MPSLVNCPTCGKQIEYSTRNAFRPFCSERCKQLDLGAWASERYAIPGPASDPLGELNQDPATGQKARD